jgi:hypothetical protein
MYKLTNKQIDKEKDGHTETNVQADKWTLRQRDR